jgi:hypothetical protein
MAGGAVVGAAAGISVVVVNAAVVVETLVVDVVDVVEVDVTVGRGRLTARSLEGECELHSRPDATAAPMPASPTTTASRATNSPGVRWRRVRSTRRDAPTSSARRPASRPGAQLRCRTVRLPGTAETMPSPAETRRPQTSHMPRIRARPAMPAP